MYLCTEKDSVRTDRHMDYFDEDKNIKELKRILGTFALHNPQLGTVHVVCMTTSTLCFPLSLYNHNFV